MTEKQIETIKKLRKEVKSLRTKLWKFRGLMNSIKQKLPRGYI
jgi:hypothetical protein